MKMIDDYQGVKIVVITKAATRKKPKRVTARLEWKAVHISVKPVLGDTPTEKEMMSRCKVLVNRLTGGSPLSDKDKARLFEKWEREKDESDTNG